MVGPSHPYLDLVIARSAAPARDWLLARAARLDVASFALVYTGAGRRLGTAPLEASAEELSRLEQAGLPVPRGWPIAAVGRAALLALVCQGLERAARVALAASVFKTG